MNQTRYELLVNRHGKLVNEDQNWLTQPVRLHSQLELVTNMISLHNVPLEHSDENRSIIAHVGIDSMNRLPPQRMIRIG